MPVKRACGKDDAELWTGPLDFPDGCTLDLYAALLDPPLIALLVDFYVFVTARSCDTFAGPIKTEVVDDDAWRKFCDYVDLVLLNLHFGDFNKIMG